MQPRNPSNARGIDVSHWQGEIDWQRVKASGITFAFIKATEGQSYVDNQFATNLRAARQAGILAGAYHFCRAQNVAEAKLEAEHFIRTINLNGGFHNLSLPPALDIETTEAKTKALISDVCRTWINQVNTASGGASLIYTNQYFAQNYLDDSLAWIPLWFARYNHNRPANVAGWSRWTFLQYSNQGDILGISGKVDLNEYDGSVTKLRTINEPASQDKQLELALANLTTLINSPEYWQENAIAGKKVKGEYAAQLITRFAQAVAPDLILQAAVNVIQQVGVSQSPEYWLQNAVPGGEVKGEFAAELIKNMADYFNNQQTVNQGE